MIAKITKGSGFGGVIRYVLDVNKKPVMLEAKQCWGENADDIAMELTEVAKFRPTTKLPVRHFSIGFAHSDGVVDDNIKSEIAARIMEEMGYRDCQYFAVAHHRDDPNHHHIHDHDHIHIVANAITYRGERITDFKDYYNLEQCLREIEIDYGLERVVSSWEKVKQAKAIPAPSELQDKIDKALTDSPSLREWIERLEASGVNLRFKITSRGCVQGVSYIHDGKIEKGGDVERSWKSLSSRFDQTPENLELMQSANLKTQSMSITLRREDQELLIKAADLAIQKLAGEDKFKDKSVKITIGDDVLKVQRLRPNKIMLSAKKDEHGKWKAIGVPNIDPKRDLQILGASQQIIEEKTSIEQTTIEQSERQVIDESKITVELDEQKTEPVLDETKQIIAKQNVFHSDVEHTGSEILEAQTTIETKTSIEPEVEQSNPQISTPTVEVKSKISKPVKSSKKSKDRGR
jgi:Relaxase/Mobilisation nuclease domain